LILPREWHEELVASAARAPSAHNTQPARWRFADGMVELHQRVDRRLAVGDPTGRDQAIALGCAWEGMALALSQRGVRLGAPQCVADEASRSLALVARATVEDGHPEDPLARAVPLRRAHRGAFPPATPELLHQLAEFHRDHPEVVLERDPEALRRIGADYDAAAVRGLLLPGFAEELYAWTRFHRSHPGWSRDGLAADCLALSPWEAAAARIVMRPPIVRALGAAGLAKILVSEAVKVRSSTAIAFLFAESGEDPFQTGRSFYRIWLELAARGFAAVPMSALGDDPAAAAMIVSRHAPRQGMALVNTLRIGPMPDPMPPASARLPARELLLDAVTGA
jgi:nitroreductase